MDITISKWRPDQSIINISSHGRIRCNGDEKDIWMFYPVTLSAFPSEKYLETLKKRFLRFVSGDGTKVQEEGVLKVYDEKTAEEIVHGGYEYISPEGRSIKLKYFADGSGFHAFSDDVVPSAGVAPLAEYDRYFDEKHQIRGVYDPLIARSLADPTQKGGVPVITSNSFEVERH